MIPVITLDGTVGAGKGTISQMLATQLNWHYLDSGAVYRVLAVAAIQQGVDLTNISDLVALAPALKVTFEPNIQHEPARVSLNGDDVTGMVREEKTGEMASQIAAVPEVRAALLRYQRSFRQVPGLVTDGRDMGTVVFPDALIKFYLTASVEERAKRRQQQLQGQGINVTLRALEIEIAKRDERDQNRKVSPLKPADDAMIVDTSGLGIEAVFERVWNVCKMRLRIC